MACLFVPWYFPAEDRSEKTIRKGRETRAGMEGRVQEEKLGQSPLRHICYDLLSLALSQRCFGFTVCLRTCWIILVCICLYDQTSSIFGVEVNMSCSNRYSCDTDA